MDSDSTARKKKLRLHTRTCWLFGGSQGEAAPFAARDAVAPELVVSGKSSPAESIAPGTDRDPVTVVSTGSASVAEASTDGDDEIESQSQSEVASDRAAGAVAFSEEYEILEAIGEGAVCNVYAVRSKSLDRTFALKVLKDELTSNQAAVRQFKKEVDAAVSLTHANIAAVYGHGQTEQGAPFVIQQLCEGSNLAELSKQQRPSLDWALNIFTQICDAMSHAHTKAVIHRDLKPSNVVVVSQGGEEAVRLIDFGMASVLQSARSAVTDVTRTGEVFGTPHYMSPEQCLGSKVSEASDIYSFGCLMYEIMCGSPPFSGINPVQIILRHLKETPSPFNDCHDCLEYSERARQLEQVVMRCLQKDPADRYQSFDEVKSELEAIVAGQPIATHCGDAVPATKSRLLASAVDGAAIFSICSFVPYLALFISACGLPSIPIPGAFSPLVQTLFFAIPEFQMSYWLSHLLTPSFFASMIPLTLVLYPLIGCLYHALFESSKLQATPGKLLFGMAVVDHRGERLSPAQAAIRFFSKVLAPYCIAVELTIGMERRASMRVLRQKLKYLPIDRLTRQFVVRRESRDLVAIKGLVYPSPYAQSIERMHSQIKRLNATLIGGSVLAALDSWYQLVLWRAGDVLAQPNLIFLILCAIFLPVAFTYRQALIKDKNLRLADRQAAESGMLSWTDDLMRRISIEQTGQTADQT